MVKRWLLVGFFFALPLQASDVTLYLKDFPKKLSDWHLVKRQQDTLQFNRRVLPYAINAPLFSDYALKFRTVWMPAGTQATYQAKGVFQFPVGTILTKTFYYPSDQKLPEGPEPIPELSAEGPPSGQQLTFRIEGVKIIETRLLVRTPAGWVGLPYVWNDGQTDAFFSLTGAVKTLRVPHARRAEEVIRYRVPNVNQCTDCHGQFTDRDKYFTPIGLKGRQLNREFPYPEKSENQIERWVKVGYLKGVPADLSQVEQGTVWNDSTAPQSESLKRRARAYLDVNCAHCHNPNGIARPTGLFLRFDDEDRFLKVGRPAVAAGPGAGNRLVDIDPGHPERSILMYRMETLQPEGRMPPVGRSARHEEGLDLIRKWIEELK